jgi:Fur family ferric uptake transcriptional regulator
MIMKTAAENPLGNKLKNELRESGYFLTHQRELIVDHLLSVDSHFDIEEFYEGIRKKRTPVSRATVYRTVACLEKIGLVRKTNFDEAHAHFELVSDEKAYHEHLVCRKCGKVTEFSHEHIEKHIREIARSHGFRISSHSLQIFGICSECRERAAGTGEEREN